MLPPDVSAFYRHRIRQVGVAKVTLFTLYDVNT